MKQYLFSDERSFEGGEVGRWYTSDPGSFLGTWYGFATDGEECLRIYTGAGNLAGRALLEWVPMVGNVPGFTVNVAKRSNVGDDVRARVRLSGASADESTVVQLAVAEVHPVGAEVWSELSSAAGETPLPAGIDKVRLEIEFVKEDGSSFGWNPYFFADGCSLHQVAPPDPLPTEGFPGTAIKGLFGVSKSPIEVREPNPGLPIFLQDKCNVSWWTWRAPQSGTVIFDSEATTSSEDEFGQLVMAVYLADEDGGLTEVATDDVGNGVYDWARLGVPVTGGKVYHIALGTFWTGETGEYGLIWGMDGASPLVKVSGLNGVAPEDMEEAASPLVRLTENTYVQGVTERYNHKLLKYTISGDSVSVSTLFSVPTPTDYWTTWAAGANTPNWVSKMGHGTDTDVIFMYLQAVSNTMEQEYTQLIPYESRDSGSTDGETWPGWVAGPGLLPPVTGWHQWGASWSGYVKASGTVSGTINSYIELPDVALPDEDFVNLYEYVYGHFVGDPYYWVEGTSWVAGTHQLQVRWKTASGTVLRTDTAEAIQWGTSGASYSYFNNMYPPAGAKKFDFRINIVATPAASHGGTIPAGTSVARMGDLSAMQRQHESKWVVEHVRVTDSGFTRGVPLSFRARKYTHACVVGLSSSQAIIGKAEFYGPEWTQYPTYENEIQVLGCNTSTQELYASGAPSTILDDQSSYYFGGGTTLVEGTSDLVLFTWLGYTALVRVQGTSVTLLDSHDTNSSSYWTRPQFHYWKTVGDEVWYLAPDFWPFNWFTHALMVAKVNTATGTLTIEQKHRQAGLHENAFLGDQRFGYMAGIFENEEGTFVLSSHPDNERLRAIRIDSTGQFEDDPVPGQLHDVQYYHLLQSAPAPGGRILLTHGTEVNGLSASLLQLNSTLGQTIGFWGRLGGLLSLCDEILPVAGRSAEGAEPSPETGGYFWFPSLAPSTELAHSGLYSFMRTANSSNTSAFLGHTCDPVPVTPGRYLEWRGWTYVDNFPGPDYQVRAEFEFYDAAGEDMGWNEPGVTYANTAEWTQFKRTILVPEGAATVLLYVTFYNPHQFPSGSGTSNRWPTGTRVALDDMSLLQCAPPALSGWVEVTPMPTARAVLSAHVWNNQIFVIGTPNVYPYYPANEMYDPGRDSWTKKADIGGSSYPTSNDGYERTGCSIKNFVYVINGTRVYAYDMERDVWRRRADRSYFGFSFGSYVAVDSDIYCFDRSSGIQIYHTETDTWTYDAYPWPDAREGAGAVYLGGYIYTVGGSHYYEANRFDPATGTWRNLPEPPGGVEFFDGASQVAEYRGKVYVVGGERPDDDDAHMRLSASYDPETDQWAMESPAIHRRHLSALVNCGGALFHFGGEDWYGNTAAAERLGTYTPGPLETPLPALNDVATSNSSGSQNWHSYGTEVQAFGESSNTNYTGGLQPAELLVGAASLGFYNWDVYQGQITFPLTGVPEGADVLGASIGLWLKESPSTGTEAWGSTIKEDLDPVGGYIKRSVVASQPSLGSFNVTGYGVNMSHRKVVSSDALVDRVQYHVTNGGTFRQLRVVVLSDRVLAGDHALGTYSIYSSWNTQGYKPVLYVTWRL